jgi:hypothetical protein
LDKDKDEKVRTTAEWARGQIATTEKERMQQVELLLKIKAASKG